MGDMYSHHPRISRLAELLQVLLDGGVEADGMEVSASVETTKSAFACEINRVVRVATVMDGEPENLDVVIYCEHGPEWKREGYSGYPDYDRFFLEPSADDVVNVFRRLGSWEKKWVLDQIKEE